MKRLTTSRERAFTLLELLVVILVVGILIAVAAPSFLTNTDKAHDSEAKQYLSVAYRVGKAVWIAEGNKFPAAGATADAAGEDTLIGKLKASEPQFRVVDATTGVSGETALQVAAVRVNKDVATYQSRSKSGTIFCLQTVERAQGSGASLIRAGLYWSWGKGEYACGEPPAEGSTAGPGGPGGSTGGTPPDDMSVVVGPGNMPNPDNSSRACPSGCPLPFPTRIIAPGDDGGGGTAQPVGNGSAVLQPVCNELPAEPYPTSVRADGAAGYWRMCQPDSSQSRTFLDESLTGATPFGRTICCLGNNRLNRSSNSPISGSLNYSQQMNGGGITGYGPAVNRYRQPFSVEVWVRPSSSFTTSNGAFGWAIPLAGQQCHWNFGWAGTRGSRFNAATPIGSDGWTFTFYDQDEPCQGVASSNTQRVHTTYPVVAGQWYHMVATYDGNSVAIYANGQQLTNQPVAPITSPEIAGGSFRPLQYGQLETENPDGDLYNSSYWSVFSRDGLDEAAFYHTALSPSQVASHYMAASAAPARNTDPAGPPSAYRSAIQASNPLLWWPLDDPNLSVSSISDCGTPYTTTCALYERVGGAVTGAGQNITAASLTQVTGPEKLGSQNRGQTFHGSSTSQYMAANSATIEFWMQAWKDPVTTTTPLGAPHTLPATGSSVLLAQQNGGSPYSELKIHLNDGRPAVQSSRDGISVPTSLGGPDLRDSRWHHIALVRDVAGTREWRLYVDGVASEVTLPTTADTGYYGNINGSLGWGGQGDEHLAFDEFTVYNRALPASEIEGHYAAGS